MKNRRAAGGFGASRRHLQIARTSLATSRAAGNFEASRRFLQDSHSLRQLSAKRLILKCLVVFCRLPTLYGNFPRGEYSRCFVIFCRSLTPRDGFPRLGAFRSVPSPFADRPCFRDGSFPRSGAQRFRGKSAAGACSQNLHPLIKRQIHFKFHRGIRSGISFGNSRPLSKARLSSFS